ncbi:hypothetical protein QTN25_010662 [Entamoeba marina]
MSKGLDDISEIPKEISLALDEAMYNSLDDGHAILMSSSCVQSKDESSFNITTPTQTPQTSESPKNQANTKNNKGSETKSKPKFPQLPESLKNIHNTTKPHTLRTRNGNNKCKSPPLKQQRIEEEETKK